MANHLLRADPLPGVDNFAPPELDIHAIEESDLSDIGRAYLLSFEETPHAMTQAESRADVEAAWKGEYGTWNTSCSLGAWMGGALVGAILTVTDAPWEDVPSGPFISDLFVVPAARRHGVARALVQTVRSRVDGGIALRVDDSATAARALYDGLGFTVVDPSCQDNSRHRTA
jgi:ribosomal protein S18 acetylase RimI-like enzyme